MKCSAPAEWKVGSSQYKRAGGGAMRCRRADKAGEKKKKQLLSFGPPLRPQRSFSFFAAINMYTPVQ